jgi:cytochrome c553
MKKIIIAVLLTCVGFMAAEGAQANMSGYSVDGAKMYKQRCSLCHGEKAEKVPTDSVAALAGRDVVELALKIRSYRDQDNDIGSYTMHKESQLMKDATSNLSREAIVALAKYISSIK